MATLPPVTDTIARFVTETDLSAVSAKTRVNATMHILDVLGVALAGVSTPPAEIDLDYCKRLGVATEGSIWGAHGMDSRSERIALIVGMSINAIVYSLIAFGLLKWFGHSNESRSPRDE